MATSNFLQWNPTAANQESDSTYLADSQRVGGATDPSIFDAALANKLFYQLSTGMTALMQMMAYKGFPVSDASLGTLAAQLANILTTADLRGYAGLQTVPYASSVVLNAGQYLNWQVALNGNTSITVAGALPGDLLTVIFVNDSTGGHTVSWSAPFVNGAQPGAAGGATSICTFKVRLDGSVVPSGPVMMLGGVVNTAIDSSPIGATTPSTGIFTTAAASVQLTAPTVASTDNSTKVATTAWVQYLMANSIPGSQSVTLPGGFIIKYGTISDMSYGAVTFDTPFPTAVLGYACATGGYYDRITFFNVIPSTTGFSLANNGSGASAGWIVVGH